MPHINLHYMYSLFCFSPLSTYNQYKIYCVNKNLMSDAYMYPIIINALCTRARVVHILAFVGPQLFNKSLSKMY